jgi:high-affinity nickel-transport protein
VINPFDDRPGAARFRAGLICAGLIAVNIAVWAWAYAAFSTHPVLLGTAFLAYVFGLRHAFDADHIAAIDTVVRKLIQQGREPLATGLFFSLGHSSVVIAASALLALSATALQGPLSAFHPIGGVLGTLVSAFFLISIGIANLFILGGVWRAFQRARRGEPVSIEALDATLANGGFLVRIFRPLFRVVTRSWHMYPVGVLFGLGFDTATEIGVLGISATQAASGTSLAAIMIFPALFTAGMALMDTLDSVAMVGAYGWAFVKPMRKLWYNLTITAASVIVAVFIGSIEALGLVGDKLSLSGGLWDLVGSLNDNLTSFGYAVVGVFVASWLASALLYRFKRYEDFGPAKG